MTPPDIDARVAQWLAAGVVDPAGAERIREYERSAAAATPGAHEVQSERGRDRVAAFIGVLGSVLVGLGVLLVVAANWDGISSTGKLVTLVASMLTAYGLALWADHIGAPRWAGTAGYVIGTLVFAGGVFLLGQVYNVQAHSPLGLLVVALAASVIAVVSGRQLVGWIAAVAWIGWGVHEFVAVVDGVDDERAAVVILGAGLLLAIAALGIGWVLDGLAVRAAQQPALEVERSLRADLNVLGTPFRAVALIGLLGVLIPCSFAWHGGDDVVDAVAATPQLLLAAAVALGAAVLVARFGDVIARQAVAGALASGVALVVVAVLVQNAVLAGVIANILVVAGGLGLAALGLVEHRRFEYVAGVVWIVTYVIARYFDMLFTFSLGGIGFIGVGVLLLGCAWFVGRVRAAWTGRVAA